MNNQNLSADELRKIRGLSDFDLVMLISETHDNGWEAARVTLAMMPDADATKAAE